MSIGWIYLLAGTIGEVMWVMTLKSTEGFTKLWPTVLNLSIAAANVWILSLAFRLLPTAVAYSIWVGASAVAIAVCALYFQGEQMTPAKLFCIGVIVAGIVVASFLSFHEALGEPIRVFPKIDTFLSSPRPDGLGDGARTCCDANPVPDAS